MSLSELFLYLGGVPTAMTGDEVGGVRDERL